MRVSDYFLLTYKETPSEAELTSHQLMLRAGLIHRVGSGIYTWLPLGLKVLQKIEAIVREEMNKAGALEILMPNIQPSELWVESKRWEEFGPLLLKIKDRHQREFCFGPTHEEVITALLRQTLSSYKELPVNLYQIQTKFRDEIRPRFGVMRAREFIMKDSYSFHTSQSSLEDTYQKMHQAYSNIFTRLGLRFRPVDADTGAIGGSASHEFQVLADSGEDTVFYCEDSEYAANVEKAEYLKPDYAGLHDEKSIEAVDTPGAKTIDDVVKQLGLPIDETIKTLLVEGEEMPMVALVLRGDHQLNELKAEKHEAVKTPLTFIDEDKAKETLGANFGSLGPVGLDIPVIVDHSALTKPYVCSGANENDKHLLNVNFERDVKTFESAYLRNVVDGDLSPCGKGTLKSCKGIEVGHIFQVGDKYAREMKQTVLDENGKAKTVLMGCYGLGVSRVVAAAIEQHHDDKGICWPKAIAPFQVAILPMNMKKSAPVKEKAYELYEALSKQGVEVLIDDRDERAGVMFADNELIGIPHTIVIGNKGLDKGEVEYKNRSIEGKQAISTDDILSFIEKALAS